MKTASDNTLFGLPIIGIVHLKDTGECLPMVETMSDIKWVKLCIKSREEHPEYYPEEDIPIVLDRQRALLKQLMEQEKIGVNFG